MKRSKRHKKSGHGRVVVSKSGRRYRKSPRSKTGWALVSGPKRHKKRHAKRSFF